MNRGYFKYGGDVFRTQEVDGKKYRQLIANPDIARANDPNLDLATVREATQDEFSAYEESNFVRADGDYRVHQIETAQGSDAASARHVDITGEQFGSQSGVFAITGQEFGLYEQGKAIGYEEFRQQRGLGPVSTDPNDAAIQSANETAASISRNTDAIIGEDAPELERNLLERVINPGQAPEAPNFEAEIERLEDNFGLDNLEQEADLVQKEIMAMRNAQRLELNKIRYGEGGSSGKTAGRLSEAEANFNARISGLVDLANYLNNKIVDTRSAVDRILGYKQTSYENELRQYESGVNRNLQMLNLVRGYRLQTQELAEKRKADAQAEQTQFAQQVASGIISGNLSMDDLDTQTTAFMSKFDNILGSQGGTRRMIQFILENYQREEIANTTAQPLGEGYVLFKSPRTGINIRRVYTPAPRSSGGSGGYSFAQQVDDNLQERKFQASQRESAVQGVRDQFATNSIPFTGVYIPQTISIDGNYVPLSPEVISGIGSLLPAIQQKYVEHNQQVEDGVIPETSRVSPDTIAQQFIDNYLRGHENDIRERYGLGPERISGVEFEKPVSSSGVPLSGNIL